MATLVLQFNGAANELLGGNTRLRVKTQKRGSGERRRKEEEKTAGKRGMDVQ